MRTSLLDHRKCIPDSSSSIRELDIRLLQFFADWQCHWQHVTKAKNGHNKIRTTYGVNQCVCFCGRVDFQSRDNVCQFSTKQNYSIMSFDPACLAQALQLSSDSVLQDKVALTTASEESHNFFHCAHGISNSLDCWRLRQRQIQCMVKAWITRCLWRHLLYDADCTTNRWCHHTAAICANTDAVVIVKAQLWRFLRSARIRRLGGGDRPHRPLWIRHCCGWTREMWRTPASTPSSAEN